MVTVISEDVIYYLFIFCEHLQALNNSYKTKQNKKQSPLKIKQCKSLHKKTNHDIYKKIENHAELHVFHSMFAMKTKIYSDFKVFNGMHLSVTTLNFLHLTRFSVNIMVPASNIELRGFNPSVMHCQTYKFKIL